MKAEYRQLKYELDLKSGKEEDYKEVMENFQSVKTNIDNLIETGDQEQRQDILGVSCEEMIEFLNRKNVIGIVFFYAREYERLSEGDMPKSLHAICIWNGRVTAYVGGKALKYRRTYEMMKMFSQEAIVCFEGEIIEERGARRKNERISKESWEVCLEYSRRLEDK